MKQLHIFRVRKPEFMVIRTMVLSGILLLVPFIIKAQPTASISGDATVCQGAESPLITFTGSNGTAPYVFTYTINGGSEQTVNTDAGNNIATVPVPTTSTGTLVYTLTGVSDAVYGQQEASGSATVIVITVPSTPGVISGSAEVCASTTGQTYSVAEVTGATSYSWTLPAGWTISSGNGTAAITVTTGNSGGEISVSAANSCGSGTASTLDVTVRSAPAASISGTTTVCQYSASPQITFSNAGDLPVSVTYNINGSGETSISVAASGSSTVNVSTATSGAFTYNLVSVAYLTDPACSVTVGGSATVTVSPTPSVGNETTEISSGETFIVSPAGVPAGTTYTWGTPTYTGGVTGGSAQTTGVSSITGTLTISSGSGTATYIVTPLAGSCTGSTFTVTVTVNETCDPASIITQPSASTMCAGASASMSVTAGGTEPYSYQWEYNTGSGWSNVANGTPAGATYSGNTTAILSISGITTAGNYQYRCQVTNCSGSSSIESDPATLTVYALPDTPTVGTITQPTCTVSTGSVVLSDLPSGSWTINPGNITGSTSSVTVSELEPGTYTFTVTNLNGCTSVASSQVVINDQPAVPTVPVIGTVTQPTCAVSTGMVGFSGLPSIGIWTLTRHPDEVESTGTGTTTTLTGIPAGTFTFTVTNVSGCESDATGSVTINDPFPVPDAPVVTVDCSLGVNYAVVTVTSPVGTGYDYCLDGGTYQSDPDFIDVANGSHTVTVRNSSGCTTTGSSFSVNCGCTNPPLVTLSATSGNTCGVSAVTVTGNTFGGSATYVTITDNGAGIVSPSSSTTSPFSFTYTPSSSDAGTTVTVTVTTDNPLGSPCAAATATYTLTVNANPSAPVPGTVTQPTCSVATGSVMLNNLPSSGTWIITRTPGSVTYTGSGSSTTISGLATGTYTFIVTSSLGCSSPASAEVVIDDQPATPDAPVVGTITHPTCAVSTGSVELTGLPSSGTWILVGTPGNITKSSTGTSYTVTGLNSGTYTFSVTNADGCVSAFSEQVIIEAQPVTPDAPVIGTITHPTCELATGTILIEGLPEEDQWTLIRYPGGATTEGSGSSLSISSLAAGTYNFAVRNSEGCTSLVSDNAVINSQPPTPSAPVIGTITQPSVTVATGSVVLSGLPSSGIWTLTRYPDGYTSQGTGTTRTVSGLEPGTYTFTVTNSYGCTSALTANIVINSRPGAPVVVINNPETICENETTDLTLAAITEGSDANLTFTYWTDISATEQYDTPEAATEGTYYIKGTSTEGYYTIKAVVVTADKLPEAYAGLDQELDYIFNTTLIADAPDYGTGIWSRVSGSGILASPEEATTAVSGLSLNDNVFRWTVSNGACDPVTDDVVVTVNKLKIPTLITPNNDGKNDCFVLKGLSETLGKTELTIFDRRGLKVYENNDYDNSWYGVDYNGSPLPDDTYFYVIKTANGVSVAGYIVVRR